MVAEMEGPEPENLFLQFLLVWLNPVSLPEPTMFKTG
jgi:hypothetical protein